MSRDESRIAASPLLHHKAQFFLKCLQRHGVTCAGARILDVACNNGRLSELLAGEGRTLHGCDISEHSLRGARARGVDCKVADLSAGLPYESNTFDAVMASEIIEHLLDTDAFVTELHRVLTPGGIVVVTVPNINALRNRGRVLFGKYPRGVEHRLSATNSGHVRAYNLATLASQMQRCGLRVGPAAATHILPVRCSGSRWGFTLNTRLGHWLPSLGMDLMMCGIKDDGICRDRAAVGEPS